MRDMNLKWKRTPTDYVSTFYTFLFSSLFIQKLFHFILSDQLEKLFSVYFFDVKYKKMVWYFVGFSFCKS